METVSLVAQSTTCQEHQPHTHRAVAAETFVRTSHSRSEQMESAARGGFFGSHATHASRAHAVNETTTYRETHFRRFDGNELVRTVLATAVSDASISLAPQGSERTPNCWPQRRKQKN